MNLDRIDFAILDALQNNARLSNKELAALVELSASSCLQRVRKLEQSGVLRGFHADVAPERLGIGLQALVAVRLAKHSARTCGLLRAHLLKLDEVLTVFHVSGVNDFLVHVAVRDVRHLRDLIMERFATRPEVDHCETSVIYTEDTKPRLPRYDPHAP